MGKGKELTESELRLKIANYCAYQERSPKQVEEKLSKLASDQQTISKVFQWAEDEKFVSESRFAESYVSGKFQLKKWGKFKIRAGLRSHNISDEIISQALCTIDDKLYADTLINLGRKKMKLLRDSGASRWEKTVNFLIGKGFEVEVIHKLRKKLEND